jgi:hypothetical protein
MIASKYAATIHNQKRTDDPPRRDQSPSTSFSHSEAPQSDGHRVRARDAPRSAPLVASCADPG